MTPRDRFLWKALKLTFKVKKAIGCKWYKRYTDIQKKFLSDIAYFPEELIDFLQIDDFDSAEEYIKSINAFLDLEQRTFNYFYPLKYVIGRFYITLEQINLHRDFIDLKHTIFLKTEYYRIKNILCHFKKGDRKQEGELKE